jgi:uncharacterized Zn finger protein (UPF0148 family)
VNFEYSDYYLSRPCGNCGGQRARSKAGNVYCPACPKVRRQKWRLANPESAKASDAKANKRSRANYQKADKEKIAAHKREKYASDPEYRASQLKTQKKWRDANREAIRKRARDAMRVKREAAKAKVIAKQIKIYPTAEELVKIDRRNELNRLRAAKRREEKKNASL